MSADDIPDVDVEEQVRYNVQMPKQLRKGAKRNAERGELAKAVRELFREYAYGIDVERPDKTERIEVELRELRTEIDKHRHKRSQIDAKIEAMEQKAARLEERLTALREERQERKQQQEILTNMLDSGERIWPGRIQELCNVDRETASNIHEDLQDRHDDLPDEAFTEPALSSATNWKEGA